MRKGAASLLVSLDGAAGRPDGFVTDVDDGTEQTSGGVTMTVVITAFERSPMAARAWRATRAFAGRSRRWAVRTRSASSRSARRRSPRTCACTRSA